MESNGLPGPAEREPSESHDPDMETLREEIVRAIRGVCPAWIVSQAEDMAHEILIRVLEKREGNPVRQASSYWRKAAYHAVVDEIRRRRRRREDLLDDHITNGVAVATSTQDPERRAASRDMGDAIQDCVRRLRETRQLPVVLFLQGHSVPEAAALLGWAGKRVESGLYRGLRDLRACLAGKGWSR
jgi:RNA polymerase sigma-70 factor (ECF subfamily)